MSTFVKIYFHTFDLVSFLLTLDIFPTMSVCSDFEQVNTGWEGELKSKIYVIFQLFILVPLFRPSVFTVVFFSIFQFIGDTTLFGVTILRRTCKRKKQLSGSDKFLLWCHQLSLFHKGHQCYKVQLYTMTET